MITGELVMPEAYWNKYNHLSEEELLDKIFNAKPKIEKPKLPNVFTEVKKVQDNNYNPKINDFIKNPGPCASG